MAKSLPAYTQDNQYPFSYLRMGQLGYNSPGTVLAGDMQVSPGTGLQVQISAGEAYVQQTVARLGSFYASRGVYYIFDDSADNPYNTITAPVSNPRVDQVIARVYDSYEQQLSGSSYWRYEWLTGTETSGATLTNLDGAATLPANSLRLAYCLATVSMSSWSSGNILNMLPFDTGWTALTVTIGTPTSVDHPYARKIGNRVFCRGAITAASGGFQASFPNTQWGPTTINMWLPVSSTGSTERVTNATIEVVSNVLYVSQTNAGFFTNGNSYDITACSWLTN